MSTTSNVLPSDTPTRELPKKRNTKQKNKAFKKVISKKKNVKGLKKCAKKKKYQQMVTRKR